MIKNVPDKVKEIVEEHIKMIESSCKNNIKDINVTLLEFNQDN